jgi:hypothetical protein
MDGKRRTDVEFTDICQRQPVIYGDEGAVQKLNPGGGLGSG